jgi:mono/diheme cytochrome c family protein
MSNSAPTTPATLKTGSLVLAGALVVLLCAPGQTFAETSPRTLAFIQEHCLRCHGPDQAKGDLRLDRVDADLSKPSNIEAWRGILARVQSGEMPPQKEPRPPQASVAEFVAGLTKELDVASAGIRSDGRTVLRRLNRVEYENTVNDLFAVNVTVKDTLPEDAVSHGFDNVGAALNISPVQMERYLEAADTVITAALAPVHKLESTTQRFQYEMPAYITHLKQNDGIVLFRNKDGGGAHDLRAFKAPAPGRYRFRISAAAYNSEKPLPMAVLLGNFVVKAVSVNRLLGYYDVPPGNGAVIEIEERLDLKNDTIEVAPTGLPFVYLNKNNMPDYPGPGLKIHWVEVEGPLPESWPTESYRRVFGDADPKSGMLADAEKLIRALLPRAFRRAVVEGEEKPYVALVAKSLEMGQSFESSLRAGYKAVLASPKFLYLREPIGPLDDVALASRLSYFLWSTMPDETLLTLAAKRELHKLDVLRAQVERMLNHPKAKAFTENFTGQWLGLRDIAANTPDNALYPEFDEYLQWSAERETHLFFAEMLKQDLGVKNVIDSDFALLNGRLARHYGIPGVDGVAFRRVPLKPEYHRGGLITHASVLKVTANGTTTSPVVRGVWVLDRILGRPAPPPPANVPAIEPDIRGAKTIRDQLAKHRATENCAGCHSRIDPPGFALENYDVIGGWREKYRFVAVEQKDRVNNRTGPLAKYLAAWRYGLGLPVDAGDTLPDGRKFADIAEYKQLLLAHPEQVARCVTEKLVTYGTGHPVGLGDHAAVERIVAETKSKDYGLRSLIHALVASELFRNK